MVRITPDVIDAAPQFLNPVGQYELSLRGNFKENRLKEIFH